MSKEEELEKHRDKRKAISAENRALRQQVSNCKSRVRDLDKRIEAEKWDIIRIYGVIKANNEKFVEAGNEIKKLLNEETR